MNTTQACCTVQHFRRGFLRAVPFFFKNTLLGSLITMISIVVGFCATVMLALQLVYMLGAVIATHYLGANDLTPMAWFWSAEMDRMPIVASLVIGGIAVGAGYVVIWSILAFCKEACRLGNPETADAPPAPDEPKSGQ